ncbi:phage integrase N-terminal SAM-like domain-containing protein [Bacillus sp. Cr_A10]|uniref:phage integrase N-terminal SAM-like domain-containing protein n=1 Tax=Bacillus sp. Cr_A10 TaxID=3033993 RepID=UPI0023DBC2B7|nr:phage integrase N-terminal SAM-like domain-containing protein [Bacillus sp. Cr_A10]MDF2065092.1 phage integrase N-terminal SAM-like domain-containing protein [Bacillus sp. Cr_A10]
MGRKRGIFAVQVDELEVSKKPVTTKKDTITIPKALTTIYQQMRIAGNRERTIDSYNYIFNQFVVFNKLEYVEDINADSIYNYLEYLNVSNQTKLIRLKSIKAVLGKFHNNGWLKEKFWSYIQIKIDKQVKKGVKANDIDDYCH